MTRRLFVGGPKDGAWINVPDDRSFWEVAAPLAAPDYSQEVVKASDGAPMTYSRVPFVVSDRKYDIFVPWGVSADAAMHMLQEGYRRGG